MAKNSAYQSPFNLFDNPFMHNPNYGAYRRADVFMLDSKKVLKFTIPVFTNKCNTRAICMYIKIIYIKINSIYIKWRCISIGTVRKIYKIYIYESTKMYITNYWYCKL